MAIIYKVAKAKFPFTMGITQEVIPTQAVKPKKAVKPVEPKAAAEPVVVEIPETVVESVAEIVEPVTEEILAEDDLTIAGFSMKSIQLLNANNIFTVTQLKASLEVEPDITKLPKIGKISGKTIIEELTKWEAKPQEIDQ